MIHFQFELSAVEKMFELLAHQEGSKKFAVVGRLFLLRCIYYKMQLEPRAAARSPSALGSAGLEQFETDAVECRVTTFRRACLAF